MKKIYEIKTPQKNITYSILAGLQPATTPVLTIKLCAQGQMQGHTQWAQKFTLIDTN